MRMIPDVPYRTNSQAEKNVFDWLRLALPDAGFTAYHSLNLIRHAYKRFGEIDFLICGPTGLFVFEVKGGRVSRTAPGVWTYKDRYGNSHDSREGPFKQAETALHGLITTLNENLPNSVVSQFVQGFGVITPDCQLPPSAEWDPHTQAGARQCANFNRWLRAFIAYWRNKDHRQPIADTDALHTVQQYLRPRFEAITPLYIATGQAEEEIVSLTADQMMLADVVAANPRVLSAGGAGTGKTFLALEIARRWTATDDDVVLVCHSPWLKEYLANHFAMPRLSVSTARTLPVTAKRAGVQQFSALIVDEGQDLFRWDDLEMLDGYLQGGLAEGRWCFFYDVNNQANLFGGIDEDVIGLLEAAHPAHVPLRTNCRNTQEIIRTIQDKLRVNMGTGGASTGPQVREHHVNSKEHAAALLENLLQELVNEDRMMRGHITILSPSPFHESAASLLPKNVRRHLLVLDEYSMRTFPPSKSSFASIPAFKGLENECIILIDCPELSPIAEPGMRTMHYVAMSRARALLIVIQISS